MIKCVFCKGECDGKFILRDSHLQMVDGSDITLCSICMNLYANHEYEELSKRVIEK